MVSFNICQIYPSLLQMKLLMMLFSVLHSKYIVESSLFVNAFILNNCNKRNDISRRQQNQQGRCLSISSTSSPLSTLDILDNDQSILTIARSVEEEKGGQPDSKSSSNSNKNSTFEEEVFSFFKNECNLNCIPLRNNDTAHPYTNVSTMKHGVIYQLVSPSNNDNEKEEESYNQNKPSSLPYIHLLPTPASIDSITHPQSSYLLTNMQQQQQSTSTTTKTPPIIHLHEDLWYSHSTIIQSRIKAKCGIYKMTRRIYARQTISKRIPLQTAQEFLETYHLWSSTKAKFNYGLFYKSKKKKKGAEHKSKQPQQQQQQQDETDDEELIAVATFSPRRHVQRHSHPKYRSHELIRYCTKHNTSVVGGITKLLSLFIKECAPDDIVTCIDRDWGSGFENWYSAGFRRIDIMPPVVMVVERKEEEKERGGAGQGGGEAGVRKYLVGSYLDQGEEEEEKSNMKEDKISSVHKQQQRRRGIGKEALSKIPKCQTPQQVREILYSQYNMVPVYDAGVERLAFLVCGSKLEKHGWEKRKDLGLPPPPVVPCIPQHQQHEHLQDKGEARTKCMNNNKDENDSDTAALVPMTVKQIWDTSIPQYVQGYYSDNPGVTLLLEEAAANLLEE